MKKFLVLSVGHFNIHIPFIFVAFLLHTQQNGMIYSYLFYDSVNNLDYYNNLQENPAGHPFNSRTPLVNCATTFSNNASVDHFCIKTHYGLHFPKSKDDTTEIAENLDIYRIYEAHPYFTLLTRIYIDPTKVDSDQENGIRFKCYWKCEARFEIGFIIKFINPQKIKIYIHAEYYEEEGYYGNTPEFASVVPEITSPTWVDVALFFTYIYNSSMPLCLNERFYSSGVDYYFPQILSTIHTGWSDKMIIGDDVDHMNLKIISSKAFGMTVQFFGMYSGGTNTDILIHCINNYGGYLVPREFCNLATSCFDDSCCCENGNNCMNKCPVFSYSSQTCSEYYFAAQCFSSINSFTPTSSGCFKASIIPPNLVSGKSSSLFINYKFSAAICFVGIFAFVLALLIALFVRN